MGLFLHRPEHHDEWAGLPSEPRDPLSPAESLNPGETEITALVEGGIGSIVIPLPPAPAAGAGVDDSERAQDAD